MRMLAVSIWAYIFLVGGIACATPEEDVRKAYAAIENGNYQYALSIVVPLAEKGVPLAQTVLGALYLDGVGVTRDHRKAVFWYHKAAEQGEKHAQFELGAMLDRGMGVERDPEQAAYWYGKAADQGVGQAQYNLGSMYATGEGMAQDWVQAYKWFALAAIHGAEKAEAAQAATATKLTRIQLSEAKALIAMWVNERIRNWRSD